MMARTEKPPILVTDDMGEESLTGLRRSRIVHAYAEHLGEALGTPLFVVHVEKAILPSIASSTFFGERARKRLAGIVRGGVGESPRRLIVSGIPSQEILRLSRTSSPRPFLIVMGTRGRTGLKRLLLGSVAEKVIADSRLPVLTVGPALSTAPARNPFLPSTGPALLVATDLSPANQRLEAFALSLARKIRARVTLFHSPFNEYRTYEKLRVRLRKSGDLAHDVQAFMESRKAAFERHGIACGILLDTETVFVPDAIVRAARGHAAVIQGTHSRSPLAKAFIGSVARAVILDSPVPVFTLSLLGGP